MQNYRDLMRMIQIGELNKTYTMPVGIDDEKLATVAGGYFMKIYQTCTFEWYQVKKWAEIHGYNFQNEGTAFYNKENGMKPVTKVSWRDVIVWINALSEMTRFDPVYRTESGEIIRDSRDTNTNVVDKAVQTNSNGYRLPTNIEWEMAARWRNSGGDGSILVGERYWTPGNYASGASACFYNVAETREVAWYWNEPGNSPISVGQLKPNQLGIYDMSGNVWEWTFDSHPEYSSERILRGGSYYSYSTSMRVGEVSSFLPNGVSSNFGFRLVRGSTA